MYDEDHEKLLTIYYVTGKNNRFPFLDILWYLKNTHKNLKVGNSLVGTCLTLPI